jgi:hypothetical protein
MRSSNERKAARVPPTLFKLAINRKTVDALGDICSV